MQKNTLSLSLSFFIFSLATFSLKCAHGPMTRKRKEVCDNPVIAQQNFITDIISYGIDKQGERGTRNRNLYAEAKFSDYTDAYASPEIQKMVTSLAQEAGLGNKKFFAYEGDCDQLSSFKPISDKHFILQVSSKESDEDKRFSILHEMGHASLMDKEYSFSARSIQKDNHRQEFLADIFATNILLKKKDFQAVTAGILSFLNSSHKDCFTHPASERRARLMLTAFENNLAEEGESLESLFDRGDTRLDKGTKLALKRATNMLKRRD